MACGLARKLIKIPILDEDIEFSKRETKRFDEQKTYEKLDCKNNYIGLLGEITFHKWLTKQGIKHAWIDFTKQGWDEPDFIIDGKGIDLKVSTDTKMWVQEPKFYYYIFARVNDDLKNLMVIGIISKKSLNDLIKRGNLKIFERPERIDYHVYLSQMKSIESYFKKLLRKPLVYEMIE